MILNKEPIKVKLSSTVIVLLKWGIDKLPKTATSALNKAPLTKYDYRVMMVKRGNTKFFPSAHVFPGGAVDKHDSDEGWKDIIEKPLPSNLPIKISALREVFEETNFFLENNDQLINESTIGDIEKLSNNLMNLETSKTNNYLLSYLKEKLNGKLKLNNLYQWARWITPVLGPKQTHRFDTYFYVTPIDKYPESCKIDNHGENVELDWLSPDEALEAHKSGSISLPPPTWFTFLQLSKCNTLDQVLELAKDRETKDILYDPVMTKAIIPSNSSSLIPQERYQVLQGDHLHDPTNNTNSNSKNRIVTRSRIGDLNNQFSWVYEYQNTIPNSIDNHLDGANTFSTSKL